METPIIDKLSEQSKVDICFNEENTRVVIYEACDYYHPATELDKTGLTAFIAELQYLHSQLKE